MTPFKREKSNFWVNFWREYVSFISVALAFQMKLNRMLTLIGPCGPSMPERIYNPITAMGFSAMFTFQLDNTKR